MGIDLPPRLTRDPSALPPFRKFISAFALTASASMILGNVLIGTSGRAPNSFVTMDVMRLPLGILTGMGFIGAGAILHQGNMVLGVTAAVTSWVTTLVGSCFGAGEHGLGMKFRYSEDETTLHDQNGVISLPPRRVIA